MEWFLILLLVYRKKKLNGRQRDLTRKHIKTHVMIFSLRQFDAHKTRHTADGKYLRHD